MAKKIYLSPSNQNGNLYKTGNTNEMEQCNKIAAAAEKHLKRNGYSVKRAPKGQDMNKSISESNAWDADLHIPIHTNAGGGEGTVVFVYSKASANMKYATPIYNAVQAVSPGKTDYGVREYPELAELNRTSAIGVYVEVDFHDDKEIAAWIIKHTDDIGEAIAKGVCKADGKTYKPEATTESTSGTIYRVQVGAYSKKANAETMAAKLKKDGYDAIIVTVKK